MEPHNVKQYWFVAIVTPNTEKKAIERMDGLGVVERAFRVTKGNLEAHPIFHFTEKRIEDCQDDCHCADKPTEQRNCNATDTAADS